MTTTMITFISKISKVTLTFIRLIHIRQSTTMQSPARARANSLLTCVLGNHYDSNNRLYHTRWLQSSAAILTGCLYLEFGNLWISRYNGLSPNCPILSVSSTATDATSRRCTIACRRFVYRLTPRCEYRYRTLAIDSLCIIMQSFEIRLMYAAARAGKLETLEKGLCLSRYLVSEITNSTFEIIIGSGWFITAESTAVGVDETRAFLFFLTVSISTLYDVGLVVSSNLGLFVGWQALLVLLSVRLFIPLIDEWTSLGNNSFFNNRVKIMIYGSGLIKTHVRIWNWVMQIVCTIL